MQYTGFQLSRLLKKRFISRARSVGQTLFSNKYLVYTNMGISMFLSGLGDVIEQHYQIAQNENEKWEKKRSMHMAISGLSTGFLVHHGYHFLDFYFPGYAIKTVLKKIVLDQLFVSPPIISLQLTVLAVLEKSDLKTLKEELIHKGLKLYFVECLVWPPAQFINFYFLPTRFRVLYDNTISLGYDIYTSHVKHTMPLPMPDPGPSTDDKK